MRERSLADFLAGAVACVSLLGICALVRENDRTRDAPRRRQAQQKWALPIFRRGRSPEDDCRHCLGTGTCTECVPSECAVCDGTGTQPRDPMTTLRLVALWDGAA